MIALGAAYWFHATADSRQQWASFREQIGYERLHRAEQAAAAVLTKRGVLVVAEPPDKAVAGVVFRGKPLDDAAAKQVAGLYRLQSIDLADSLLTADSLSCLSGLSHLACVVLNGSRISDEGLAPSNPLQDLIALYLNKDQGFRRRLARVPRLRGLKILDLSDTKLTDGGLRQLQSLGQLDHLNLNDDAISDAGLTHLQRFGV